MTTRETELLVANAALEQEVVRLRNALEHLSKAAGQTIDVRTPEDWVNLNIGLSLSIQALSAPFTPAALSAMIAKVEKRTIERCATAVGLEDSYQDDGFKAKCKAVEQIHDLPTGQIKLEELL